MRVYKTALKPGSFNVTLRAPEHNKAKQRFDNPVGRRITKKQVTLKKLNFTNK
jgi:hypothetical protein